MLDALRLINRHGGAIWLFTTLGEGILLAVWVAGLAAVWLMADPSPELVHKVLAAVYFPDHPEELFDRIPEKILGASPKTMALLATMALFLAASILFSVTGMLGLIRQAAVEGRLSFADFFSFGFRYFFRMSALVLILAGMLMGLGWLFFRLNSLVDSQIAYWTAIWGMGGVVGLYLLACFSFAQTVMLVERTGVVRTLGSVFRLLGKRPARAGLILLGAWLSAGAGVALLGFVSAFPVADSAVFSEWDHRGDGGELFRPADALYLSRLSRHALHGNPDPGLCEDEGGVVPRQEGGRISSASAGDLEREVKGGHLER